MYKFDRKVWNFRVRKTLLIALIAPIFTSIIAPATAPSAIAAKIASGTRCEQDVGNTSGISVTTADLDCIVTFTNTTQTTWTAPAGVKVVRVLVVGAGASGDRGVCSVYWGHGGGGGQVTDTRIAVNPSTPYNVRVGIGGPATGTCPTSAPPAGSPSGSAGTSSIFGPLTANGGLPATNRSATGGTSGSNQLGGTGTGSYPGGGGGGAGGGGADINGGPGINSDISGTTFMYGSGGAGKNGVGFGTAYSGGAVDSNDPIANRGGGGADKFANGSWSTSTPGADGVVIIRYTNPYSINYNGNGATSTRTIETTPANTTNASTTLSDGKLAQGTVVSSGLLFNLNAADSSSIVNNVWYDTNRNGVTATAFGSPTYNSTEGYFQLNGSSQYLNLGSAVLPSSGVTPFTASVMFKADKPNLSDQAIFAKYQDYVGGHFIIRTTGDSKIRAWRDVNGDLPYSSVYDSGDVNYGTVTYDGTNYKLYLNGILQSSRAWGTTNSFTVDTILGARGYGTSVSQFFQGRIYSAQGYSRALTADEVLQNYNALLPNQKVSKTGFTLGQWNTEANGTGTQYESATVVDIDVLKTPYLRLKPENYSVSGSTKTWTATNGASITDAGTTKIKGTPVVNLSGGGSFGATATFPTLSGDTSAGIKFGNADLPTYTFCGVARYKGTATSLLGTQKRIFASPSLDWITGFYQDGMGANHHHNGWVTSYVTTTKDVNWHYFCDSGNRTMWDGVHIPTVNYQTTTYLPSMSINYGYEGQTSDWEVAEIIIYDEYLPINEIDSISRYFKNRFGITAGATTVQAAAALKPITNYAATSDRTLQAQWVSKITYDGNGQDKGRVPTTHIIKNSSGTLATNTGTLTKGGYKLVGWNTAADGTGTRYALGATYANLGNVLLYAQWSRNIAFPQSIIDPNSLAPWGRYKASDYVSGTSWADSSGNGRNATISGTAPTVITTTSSVANGNTASFKALDGVPTTKIEFNNPYMADGNYTLFHVARYDTGANGRVFNSANDNWLSGFHSGYSGVKYYDAWLTTNVNRYDMKWVMSTDFGRGYRSNGDYSVTSASGTDDFGPLTINGDYIAQDSDFNVAEVIIYDRKLTLDEMRLVEDYLANTYGIVGYSNYGTYLSTSTLPVGAGVGGRSDTFTATNGLGNKSFALSPVVSGITIDTSTANGVALVVSSLVPSGTYLETITATDQAGFTAQHVVTVTVSPAVKFDTSTATSIVTTSGRGAQLRLNTVNGIGTKVFTMSQTSVATSTWITLDTSTAASGYATLKVDTYTAPGNYTASISVTDSTKLRSTYIVTITVNAPPTLVSTSPLTTAPVLSDLRVNLDAGNINSYSGTGSTWTDLSGNGRNGTLQSSPTFSNSNGGILNFNGSSQYVTVPSVRSELFTVEAWVKFNALGTSNYPCVVTNQYSSNKINYAICFWNGSSIRAGYHQSGDGWLGNQTGAFTPTVDTWYQLVYKVEKVGNNYIGSLYQNGNLVPGQTTSTIAPGNDQLIDLIGRQWNSGVYINGSIPIVRIYSRALSDAEITQNYNATSPRFLNTPTNSVTLTTTQGVATSTSLYYAGLGTGTKTFTVTPSVPGVTLDTSTVNTVKVNFANTLQSTDSATARVITQTVTAYDSTGQAATTPVYVSATINPPIVITPTTPTTLTTTFGVTAYDTFTATRGMGGPYTFSVQSSAYQSAFTMTKPSANVGLLTVANNLPAGTYYETITATDSATASTTYLLTVIVNPAMTLTAAGSSTLTTTITKSASMRINIANGTGAKTMTISSPNAGITLDSSTVGSGYVAINVGTSVPANTYSVSLTIRDSTGSTTAGNFTVVVNKWPRIGPPSIASGDLKINLDGSTYSGSGQWLDSSGNGLHGTLGGAATTPTGSAPAFVSESGGYFDYSADTQHIKTSSFGSMETFTVSAWLKMPATTFTGNPGLISEYAATSSSSVNFTIQAFNGKLVGGYRRGSTWSTAMTGFTPDLNTWMHVTYVVAKNGTNSYSNRLYKNGVLQESITSTSVPEGSGGGLILGRRWDLGAATYTGEIGGVTVYGRALSAAEIVQNYNAQGFRFLATTSGTSIYTTTQGLNASISGVVATEGSGTKTFAISPIQTGISLDTSITNQYSLNIASTLEATDSITARTYYETVTATDSTTASTSLAYSIVVNPQVQLVASASSVSTTSGLAAYDTFTATFGTGNKTFTLTGSPTTSGFTLTQANNVAVLKVEPTANPGTYIETITATDSLGATRSLGVTFIVMPPPTIVGINRIESTKGVAFTSPQFGISGGTGALTMSLTKSPSNANITLTGTSSSGGYLLVGSSSETGTYLATIRVTDSLGSYSELPVTVVVNAPVTLSGSLSITKTYGVATSNGYSTNGSGTAPFSFSATPVCAVVQSTSGGYTYEKINGTDSCTWTAPVGVTSVDALLVGAGGGGGGDGGSGGGGGSINTVTSVSLPANRQLTVQVGEGGTGGVWGGGSATGGATTSISTGSTTYTAPGGSGGGGCGSASAAGGVQGSGGTAVAGGAGGYGGTGTGCGGGVGAAGSNGPTSNFLGSVTYGGGGGGGVFPTTTSTVGPNAGGSGGGGAGTASKDYPSLGLTQYFRALSSTPSNATSKEAFTTGTCGVVTGNINYTADADFPCTQKDNFQGYATGYFVAPVTGSITFYLYSDDSTDLVVTTSTANELQKSTASTSYVNATWSGFTAGQLYPISVYFTEITGAASWKLEYSYSGQAQTTIPISQLRSNAEGLAQYFRTVASPAVATAKTTFTTGTCSERVGNLNYATDSDFPCAAKDYFQGYATGYFIAPTTGSITFYMTSDDSSDLVININGTDNELQLATCCTTVSATWSGFVQGQYYPMSAYFSEIAGVATWKLEYEYTGQARTIIPTTYLRSTRDFTDPVRGTNGRGGGGGGGSAGIFKINGGKGGSGTTIIKYLTPSETATETMITAIVNQESPSGLLTLNVPAKVTVGTYTETIKVQDAANSAPYQAVVTITINKATPTVSLSLPGLVSTAKYGNAISISALASTPGRVVFKNGSSIISGCESVTAASSGIASCSWTPTAIGAVTLKATLTPTDTTNYNNSNEATFAVTVGKADTLTVTASNESLTYSGSTSLVTKPFTQSGLVAIDSLTAVSMVYSGTANDGSSYSSSTAPTKAGTYVITPDTSTAGISTISGNYLGVTVATGTLTINRAPNTSSLVYPTVNTNSAVTSPPATNYITFRPGLTDTPTTKSRLGNGVITYSTSTPSNCSVDSSTAVTSLIEAGSCVVQMTVAQGDNYLADSATATITIAKGDRTISLSSTTSTLKYTDTATVVTAISYGALDGTITYSLNSSPGCSFDALGGILTATSGTLACTLNATIAEGTNFLSATTASALSMTIAKANAPTIVIDTVTAVDYSPGNRAGISPTYTISGFKGTDAASSLTLTYSFVSNPFEIFSYSDTRTPIDAGTYRITPSAIVMSSGLATNYETPNYAGAAINFTVNRIAQDPVTIDGVNGEVSVPFTLVYRGGNNPTATATFTKVSGASCTVTGNGLNATEAGLCVVTVTVPGNRNYLAITSDSITVRVRNFTLVPVFVFGNGTTGISIAPNTTLTLGDSRCSSGCVPTLTGISPYAGAEGDVITLTGTNFTGALRVIFNVFTNATTFNVDSDTQITVQVPAGLNAGEGTLEVATPGGITARWFDFEVLP